MMAVENKGRPAIFKEWTQRKIGMPAKDWQLADQLARQRGISRNELIRRLLQQAKVQKG